MAAARAVQRAWDKAASAKFHFHPFSCLHAFHCMSHLVDNFVVYFADKTLQTNWDIL